MKIKSVLNIAAIVFSVLLGIVFIFSALAKLFPIEPFEYTFVELGLGSWQTSVFIARFFIGLELACGLLLVGNIWLRRFTLPFTAFHLIAFSIYLAIQISIYGNTGSCGCFGSYLNVSPLNAIIKNILMLLGIMFIYNYHKGVYYIKKIKWVVALSIACSLVIPFIANPVNFQISQQHYSNRLYYRLSLEILYNDEKNQPPKVDLSKGKWIIAFMSLKCQHCRIAANKLHIIKKKNPEIQIHLVLNGDDENLGDFFDETRASNLSWSKFNGASNFIKLAGSSLPNILWVNNSIVENKSKYFFLSQDEIEIWLKN